MNSMSNIKSTSIVLPPLYYPDELPYFMSSCQILALTYLIVATVRSLHLSPQKNPNYSRVALKSMPIERAPDGGEKNTGYIPLSSQIDRQNDALDMLNMEHGHIRNLIIGRDQSHLPRSLSLSRWP